MKTREISHVAIYEMKMQSRGGVFRFFVLFSLVSIVACHAYWQGQGNCENWKMVALPCSMPLVNAYLFSVVQSLFLALLVSEIPVRLGRGGALDGIHARPVDNTTLFWGTIAGNLLLFLLQNAVVIIVTVFIVNLTSLAGVGWKYYLFYLLTLNLPCWVFVAGLSLWVSGVSPSRYLSIAISVIWLAGCVFWLPYRFHGTLDYLGSGIPNLFSGITGHVNLPGYLLHRSIYFFTGLGFLFLGASRVHRLPNHAGTRGYYLRGGVLLVLAGFCCVLFLERGYKRARDARTGYRASFERHWREETCRVRRHSITLEQAGERLKTRSDLSVYNPGSQRLERVVLFLNPGLRVTGLSLDGNAVEHERDGQVILIERGLDAGDSLRLRLEYEGEIDARYCDLHLPDAVFEDSFRGDTFFPTGRRGAFVREDLLLLTPACAWYPVAFPPVNPLMPLATGRDFTLFRLLVKRPAQKALFSQGTRCKTASGEEFVPANPLHGLSLYGGNLERYTFPAGESYSLQFGLTSWGGAFTRRFSNVSRAAVVSLWEYWWKEEGFETIPSKNWYEPGSSYLYLLEVPVSFYLDSHPGKPEAGQVEPGMIFFGERGFEMNVVDAMNIRKIKDVEDLNTVCLAMYTGLFSYVRDLYESHPLRGIGRQKIRGRANNNCGKSLWQEQNVWIYSSKYPFIGNAVEELQNNMQNFNMEQASYSFLFPRFNDVYEYLSGHTLHDVLVDKNISQDVFRWKLKDLWMRLTLVIPRHDLENYLDSLYHYQSGEINYNSLVKICQNRWEVDVDNIIKTWVETKYEQYFKVKDIERYRDPVRKFFKVTGKVMNAGKTEGIVSLEYGKFPYGMERSSCLLNPGEAKAFILVADNGINGIDFGLSANRPFFFPFRDKEMEVDGSAWKLGDDWHLITNAEFLERDNQNEIIVDDSSAAFELVDGNLSWLQKWFSQEPRYRELQAGETTRWAPVIGDERACGDSIRGYYCISGGSGKSTAIWRVRLQEAGRYQVLGRVYKTSLMVGGEPATGVIYYYTISFAGQQKEVEVNIDIELSSRDGGACWASLGEFDFPAGEVSVTLSDKEVQGRKDVAIIADAVKWVRIE